MLLASEILIINMLRVEPELHVRAEFVEMCGCVGVCVCCWRAVNGAGRTLSCVCVCFARRWLLILPHVYVYCEVD